MMEELDANLSDRELYSLLHIMVREQGDNNQGGDEDEEN